MQVLRKLLSGVASIVDWASRSSTGISSILVLIMMGVILADVLGRSLLNQPLPGGVEFSRTILVIIVFFGLAYTQANRGHIRVDVVLTRLPGWLRAQLDRFALALGALVFSTAAVASLPATLRSIAIGEFERGVVAFPVWPSRLLMTIGLFLFAAQLVVDFLRSWRANGDVSESDTSRRVYE